ncbi:hypothetical protein OX89_04020 [Diaphorobacter sp. J5-51]|nr:hypothetical protein OX89_04020 [Diaphorobacter sp. J5-51]
MSGYLGDPLNTHAKARLMAILTRTDLALGPAPLREVSVHANFWLNAADAERLAEMGREQELSVGEVITALLVQDASQMATQKSAHQEAWPACPDELRAALDALGLAERQEQSRFYRKISQACAPETPAQHKVLFAEAGTGTGKTLAYLVAAHRFACIERGAQIGIAVPSHALMDKVLQDWGRLADSLKVPIGSTNALLGQGEFVSVTALQEILSEVEDIEQRACVSEWIAGGGRAPEGWLIQHRWTAAGLRHAAPTFQLLRSVTLDNRENDDDPGFLSYRGQWDNVPQCSVLFMTHAMLASLTWRRLMAQSRALNGSQEIREAIAAWSAVPREQRESRLYEVLNAIYASTDDTAGQHLIPDLDLLVVDEAHQLDDAFALVLSRTVSVWALRRDVQALHVAQPRIVKRSDLDALETVWKRLRAFGDEDKAMVGDDLADVVGALSAVLGDMCDRKRPRDVEPVKWRRIAAISNALRVAIQAKAATDRLVEVMVRWSPDRMWPQLTVGRLSYAREMHYLWTAIAGRSCLVSGTLYEELPQLSCEAARRALNVPFDNALTMDPVHAQWQYTPVTVCMIGTVSTAGGRPRYVRPKAEGESTELSASAANSHADWAQDVAGYIQQAHRDGAGGMLVLGTAFRDLHALAELLRPMDLAPILEHRSGLPLAFLREQFLELAENGLRPILLAAGGAWTGFDLHSEREPNACTDLVIANAPFGATSRTLAREARLRQKHGFSELVAQVTVLVRQGIGRLVRSPDTPANRRIHWLDAKIHQPSTAGLLNPIKRVFAKYRQIVVG